MNNKISVIVPVYKVEKYLDRCVESIVNQTHKNLEIILVDDGSPDNCPKLCDSWAEKDSRIKVIHKKNGGVASARNAGLDIASGDYIGFADSDDYLDIKMYEMLLDHLVSSSSDISCCLLKTAAVSEGAGEVETFDQNAFLNYMFKKGDYSVCNKLFTKKLIRDLRFSSEILIGEDGYFLYLSVKRTDSIILNYTDFYINCDDVQNSLTRNNSDIESWYSNLMISRRIWNNEKNNPVVKENSSFDYANCLLNFIANSVRLNSKSRYREIRDIVKSDYCDIISVKLNKKLAIRIRLVRYFPKLYKFILKIYFAVKYLR